MSEGPTHVSIARTRAGAGATPAPHREPAREREPEPAPHREPAREPEPEPAPHREPAREPEPEPHPEPEPAPKPKPEAAHEPEPHPARAPAPMPQPAREPKPHAAPAPAPEPEPHAEPVTDVAAIRAALAEVMDPELPMVSIVDLGMVGAVEVDAGSPGALRGPVGAIRVELLPTFVGCPALDVIRDAVTARLEAFGRPVAVEVTFAPPWTTDRVTPEGRRALAAAGIAGPAETADVRCPYCRSDRVVMDSTFGPTQCRSLYYCRDCRQPFEAMKLV